MLCRVDGECLCAECYINTKCQHRMGDSSGLFIMRPRKWIIYYVLVCVCVDVLMFILVILTFVAAVTYSRKLKSEHGAKSTKRK